MTYTIQETSYGYRLELYDGGQMVRESMHRTIKDAKRTAHMAGAKLKGE